jgi:hypothetical protein
MAIISGGNYPAGTGYGDPLAWPTAPVSGTTLAGIAPPGAELVDVSTGNRYRNTGTQASPTWTAHPA